MPKTNKTQNVLKALNLEAKEKSKKQEDAQPELVCEPLELQEKARKKNRRKAITKHMKLDELTSPVSENPVIKRAVPVKESVEIEPKFYQRRKGDERQIVSVALLLLIEQLGVAVERFNVCACDECLSVMISKAIEQLPPVFVRVVTDEDENEVNRLSEEHRARVIKTLTKICLEAKNKAFHKK